MVEKILGTIYSTFFTWCYFPYVQFLLTVFLLRVLLSSYVYVLYPYVYLLYSYVYLLYSYVYLLYSYMYLLYSYVYLLYSYVYLLYSYVYLLYYVCIAVLTLDARTAG